MKSESSCTCVCVSKFFIIRLSHKSFQIGTMIVEPLNKRVVQVYRQPIALILKSDLIKYQLIDWQFQWFESKHFCLWFDLTSQWKCFATYKYGGWSDNLIERKIVLKSFERPSCSVVLSTYYLLPYITKSLSISTWVDQADKSLKLLLQQPLHNIPRRFKESGRLGRFVNITAIFLLLLLFRYELSLPTHLK